MSWFKRRRKAKKIEPRGYPPLQTERLVLRMFDPGDTVDVFAYAQSPLVGPMAGWPPHRTIEESRMVVDRFISNGDVWAIVEKKGGRVIGSVGLHPDRKRDVENAKMIGYALGEKYWGRGYATEAASAVLRYAFESLECPIVSAYHYPHNARSKRVIKKLGFSTEGTLRLASTLTNGCLCDDVCCSLTREDYFARVRKEAAKTASAPKP
ncbi:MAG: GNAT family protein [Eubacteriales bacterium]|nr:GNAT family protein [Eubacteriales bacterium]